MTDLEALARSLDALIAFADHDKNFVLAATLDAARVQFIERYGQAKD
ncbi:hypothetical protein U1737_08015 [Sphingomonas sp. LB3N6]